MGEEEASKEDAGEARPPGEEEDAQDDRRSTTNHMDEEEAAEQTPTGADEAMANKVQFSDQTSNVESEGATQLPKRAPAEKTKGAHTDNQISAEESPTDFVLEKSEEEAEADAPGKMLFLQH